MGVENLYSYVRSSIQESFRFKKVNPNLDDNFNYREIVFDGTCWLWRYMKGNYLMDYNQIKQTCQRMVDQFKRFGFKLIVFIDANICYNKIETWLQRRASRSTLIFQLNNFLKKQNNNYPKQSNNSRLWFANNGCYFFIGQIFKSCGCNVYYAHIDCDREMIGYYKLNKHKVYAVCSVDTDFLIFDVDTYLEMTSIQFNGNTLHINGYKHNTFLKRFQLKQHHLSQLAAIMGCDVLPRSIPYISMINKLYKNHSSVAHGEVYTIARYLRDLERNEHRYQQQLLKNINENKNTKQTQKQKQKQTNKNKKGKGNYKKKHKGIKMDISKMRYNKNIKRKFAICKNFYTPIYPLNILDSPYLIMLMFQNYNDCKQEEYEMKLNENDKYKHGVILDACMDDTSLIFPKQCSAVILSDLRKYLYSHLCINNTDNKCENIEFKEIICYPYPKYNYQPKSLTHIWRKGVIVNLNQCDDNPLLKLQSYQFIIKNNYNVDLIPNGLIVDDIIFLLKWLKIKNTQIEKKENIKHEMDVDEIRTNDCENVSFCSSKADKKNRRKKLEEIKRLQGLAMLNDRHVYMSGNNKISKKNVKCMDKVNDKNLKDKMWDKFDLILDCFIFQWKYRNIFLCEPYRNNIIYKKSKCKEFKQKYSKKMSPISMHFQSIICGIYEIIFAFLRLETNKWFKQMYNEKQEMPSLKIYDDNMREIESNIDKWKEMLASCTDIVIPYYWDIFNVKLYQWIFHNADCAKKWIQDCTI